MKQMAKYSSLGIVLAVFIFLIANNFTMFAKGERLLNSTFFFWREESIIDVDKIEQGNWQNPYTSNKVKVVAIDDDALQKIGKWPWYRDVHARFLHTIERFSPSLVHFDVTFALPERIPDSIIAELGDDPQNLQRVREIFQGMDNKFAEALKKYENVSFNLILEPKRKPSPADAEWLSKIEEISDVYTLPVADEGEVFSHFLIPVLADFGQNSHLVTVNTPLDEVDETIRNFPLVHLYETTSGKKRYHPSLVLHMLLQYYRIDKESVLVEDKRIVLQNARVPILNSDNQLQIHEDDFVALQRQIDVASGKPAHYNKSLYNFLVYDLTVMSPSPEKQPFYPIHLLQKGDRYELLDGREIYDVANELGSQKIKYILYREQDVAITTITGQSLNTIDMKHSMPINYPGRKGLANQSYAAAYGIGSVPEFPGGEDAITDSLLQWFFHYCANKQQHLLRECQNAYGELTEENIIRYVTEDNLLEGHFFFFQTFFEQMQEQLPEEKLSFDEYVEYYAQWAEQGGLPENMPVLSRDQLVNALYEIYGKGFNDYYGKLLLVGGYSAGIADDIKPTPYGKIFGVDVIASAFCTVATENQLYHASAWHNFLLLLCLCLVAAVVYGRFNVKVSVTVFALLFLAIIVIGYKFFLDNYQIQVVPLLLGNILVFVGVVSIKLLTEERDRKFLQASFAQYISPELIDIMYEAKIKPQLGGTDGVFTAFFSDIQGFSTFSEKLTASQLVELLNEYLSEMTEILLKEGGTLDKYIGDAIVAFFGAPMNQEDHSVRACRVAINMQNRLGELREKWRNEKSSENRNSKNLPEDEWKPGDKWPKIVHDMRMRIGLNTGGIVVGNMGSSTRMNYTMMGDPVNLAARLEAGAKQFGVYNMVSEFIAEHQFIDNVGFRVKVSELVELRFLDRITVVGKSEPVKVYELICLKGHLSSKERTLLELFDDAMNSYLQMNWDEAIAKFEKTLQFERFSDAKTTPSDVFIQRCQLFKESPPVPPGEEWDGIYRMTKK